MIEIDFVISVSCTEMMLYRRDKTRLPNYILYNVYSRDVRFFFAIFFKHVPTS